MSLDVHAPACSQACSQYSHHAAPHAPRGAYLLKLVSICASVYGMSMNWEGLFSLTYFTNLSNIAMSCVLADFFFFDRAFAPRPVELLYGVVPPLAYVGYVCVLSLGFGVRWKGSMLAPYNFLNFGAETGWFGYNPGHISSTSLGIGVAYFIIVFALIFLAMAAGLLRAMKALRKR